MTETTIRRLPDGKWELLQVYDSWGELAEAVEMLAIDSGDEKWAEDDSVELPTAEPKWDGVFRVGDEGLTEGGFHYIIERHNDKTNYPLHGRTYTRDEWVRRTWTTKGVYACGGPHVYNLMPPTKRGPANAD